MTLVSKSELSKMLQRSIPRLKPKDESHSEAVVKRQISLREQARDYMKRFQ